MFGCWISGLGAIGFRVWASRVLEQCCRVWGLGLGVSDFSL